MISFIDEHRDDYGVESICRVLPIAPSTYHERVAQRHDPSRLSPRAQRDEAMNPEVRRVFDANFKVYVVRKVWRQMRSADHTSELQSLMRISYAVFFFHNNLFFFF